MTFTNEQRQALERQGCVAVTLDGIECVVLRSDAYNQVRAILADGLNHDDLRAMLGRSAENSDWLGSAMDIYDDYDNQR
jgi:hypothetical protein